MSPKVLAEGALIFWFHSHDALHENRASVHVGKGSQSDHSDAKIWLEPEIEVGEPRGASSVSASCATPSNSSRTI